MHIYTIISIFFCVVTTWPVDAKMVHLTYSEFEKFQAPYICEDGIPHYPIACTKIFPKFRFPFRRGTVRKCKEKKVKLWKGVTLTLVLMHCPWMIDDKSQYAIGRGEGVNDGYLYHCLNDGICYPEQNLKDALIDN